MGRLKGSSRAEPKPWACNDPAVLVTGGAGFVGSHVAEKLLSKGVCVAIVDKLTRSDDGDDDHDDDEGHQDHVRIKRANVASMVEAYGREKIRFYHGDVANEDFMSEVFIREAPTKVLHLAAREGVRSSLEDPLGYVRANVQGTALMLELAHLHGVESFVYTSSSSVYGGISDATKSLVESDRVDRPISPYAATKASCELLAHTYHHLYDMSVTGVRLFTVFGPRGRPDMAPFTFIDKILRDEPIPRFGEGKTSRDYTYIDDITFGIIQALDKPSGFKLYNLGHGSPVMLNEFIWHVERATGKWAVVQSLPLQQGDTLHTNADISAARKDLDYNPTTTIAAGIQSTVNWYKAEFSSVDEHGEPRDVWGLNDADQAALMRDIAEIYSEDYDGDRDGTLSGSGRHYLPADAPPFIQQPLLQQSIGDYPIPLKYAVGLQIFVFAAIIMLSSTGWCRLDARNGRRCLNFASKYHQQYYTQ